MGEDTEFEMKLRKAKLIDYVALKLEEYFFIWRWNCGWLQISKHKKKWYSDDKGVFEIKPQWDRDYIGETRSLIK